MVGNDAVDWIDILGRAPSRVAEFGLGRRTCGCLIFTIKRTSDINTLPHLMDDANESGLDLFDGNVIPDREVGVWGSKPLSLNLFTKWKDDDDCKCLKGKKAKIRVMWTTEDKDGRDAFLYNNDIAAGDGFKESQISSSGFNLSVTIFPKAPVPRPAVGKKVKLKVYDEAGLCFEKEYEIVDKMNLDEND